VASLPVSLDDRMSTVGEAVTDDAFLIGRRIDRVKKEIYYELVESVGLLHFIPILLAKYSGVECSVNR